MTRLFQSLQSGTGAAGAVKSASNQEKPHVKIPSKPWNGLSAPPLPRVPKDGAGGGFESSTMPRGSLNSFGSPQSLANSVETLISISTTTSKSRDGSPANARGGESDINNKTEEEEEEEEGDTDEEEEEEQETEDEPASVVSVSGEGNTPGKDALNATGGARKKKMKKKRRKKQKTQSEEKEEEKQEGEEGSNKGGAEEAEIGKEAERIGDGMKSSDEDESTTTTTATTATLAGAVTESTISNSSAGLLNGQIALFIRMRDIMNRYVQSVSSKRLD